MFRLEHTQMIRSLDLYVCLCDSVNLNSSNVVEWQMDFVKSSVKLAIIFETILDRAQHFNITHSAILHNTTQLNSAQHLTTSIQALAEISIQRTTDPWQPTKTVLWTIIDHDNGPREREREREGRLILHILHREREDHTSLMYACFMWHLIVNLQ